VFFLNAHYRSPVEYSDAAMEAARAQVAEFRAAARVAEARASAFTWDSFRAALDDDFDTPRALSILHAWRAAGQVELLGRGLRVFGVAIDDDGAEVPPEVHRLAEARQAARQRRDFRDADRLRSEIDRLGWDVQDAAGGAFRLVRKRREAPGAHAFRALTYWIWINVLRAPPRRRRLDTGLPIPGAPLSRLS
jgi:cysteinyl-tRNA synthetase